MAPIPRELLYPCALPRWTKRMKDKLGFRRGDDGLFWMSFEDFLHVRASVCAPCAGHA